MSRDNLELVAEELIENPTPLDTPLKSLPVVSDDEYAISPSARAAPP
jgi:hypothetical protein